MVVAIVYKKTYLTQWRCTISTMSQDAAILGLLMKTACDREIVGRAACSGSSPAAEPLLEGSRRSPSKLNTFVFDTVNFA